MDSIRENEKDRRRKRVNCLKKIILFSILFAILLPCMLAVILGVRLHFESRENEALRALNEQLNQDMKNQEQALLQLQEQLGRVTVDSVVSEAEGSTQDVQVSDGKKKVYLTFDDGPSQNTTTILDTLAAYDAKATFFVVGDTSSSGKELYKRIAQDGHSIGIHSYSHIYNQIYSSKDAFLDDFYEMSDLLYDVTGQRPVICRLPGGSSNTVSSIDMADLVSTLNSQGITCYDWNISGGDADGATADAQEIADRVIAGVNQFETSIVLLHDGKDKQSTAEALKLILEQLKQRDDVEILPITEKTPVILHIRIS